MSRKDWMPAIARAAASDRNLKRGESLFRQGGKTVGLYEILSGSVRLVRVDRAGRETILHNAGPGDTFAEASLFSAQYHCDAVASTNATVRLYPKQQLLAALEENPKAMKAFASTLAHLVMDLRTRLEQGGLKLRRGSAVEVGELLSSDSPKLPRQRLGDEMPSIHLIALTIPAFDQGRAKASLGL